MSYNIIPTMDQEDTSSKALNLQDLCMIEIINDLDCYAPELLARLPTRFRRQLLHNLPALDLCQLEHSPVAHGVDLNSVWKDKYPPWNNLGGTVRVRNVSYFTVRSKEDSDVDWKQEYMSILCHSVLETQAAIVYTNMSVYQYTEHYQRPVVDWLVTIKAASFLKPDADAYVERLERLTQLFFVEAENGKRLDRIVPARYVKMRISASSTTQEKLLDLIVNRCHFRPQFLSVEIFKLHSTPLLSHTSVQCQSLLDALLSGVEELQINGSIPLDIHEHPSVSIARDTPKKFLKAPNLKSLQIQFNTLPNVSASGSKSLAEEFLSSFSPFIFSLDSTPMYTSLTKLCVKDCLEPNCVQLIAGMIEQQVNLKHLSLDTLYSDRLKDKSAASLKPLLLAITSFCERSNFESLSVSFACFHPTVLRYLFGTFLTVACAHEQKFYLKKVVASPRNTSPFISFEDWTQVPDCGATHKEVCSLDDFGLGSSIYTVLFSLPVVQMKSLQVSVNHWDTESLHTAAQHPRLYLEELYLVLCSTTLTLAEDLKKLFQIPTLKKASITLRTEAEDTLPILADAVAGAYTSLHVIELIGCDFTSITENCMAMLFDSVFSLTQKANLSLDVSKCSPPGLLLPLIADTVLTSYQQNVEDTGDDSPLKELLVPRGNFEEEEEEEGFDPDEEEEFGEDSDLEMTMLLPAEVVGSVVLV